MISRTDKGPAPIPHGVQAKNVITGYVRAGVLLAEQRGDAINRIPYGVTMLARILGRPPADFELQFAAQETSRVLAHTGRPQEGTR